MKKENHRRLGIRFGILGTAVCVFGLTIGLLISMAQSAKSEAAGAAALAEAERARAEAETARADAEKEQAKMAKEQAKMASARFEAERKNAEVQARAAESAKNQEAQIGGLTTRIRDLESGTEDLKNIVTPLMKLVESSAEKPSPELLALLQKQGFTSGASQSPESSLTLSLPALADLNLSSWRQDGFGPVSSVALVDGSNSGEVKLLLGGRSAFWEVPLLLNEQGVISSAQKSLDLAGYKAWNQSVGSISVSTSHDSQDWYLVTNGGPDIGIRRGAAAPWETISTREQTRQAGVTRAKLVAGHKIVFGTGDGQLGWLDANKRDTPAKLFKSDHKGIINDLSMNPAGDLLLASGDDQMATLWQIMPEGALKPLSKVSCGAPVRSASFSPNGRWALIPSGEREIRLYLLAAAEPAFVESQSIALQHDMPVVIGSFSPDGRWIATATTQGEIRIWQSVPDPRPGKAQPVCTLNTAQRPSAMLWSPDGSILATADTGGNVALWQFQADGVLTAVPNFMPSMSAAVDALAWSPDGGLLIYGNSEGSAQVRQVGAFAAGSRLEDLQDGKRLQIAQTILEIEGGFPEDGNSKRDNLAVSDWVALLKKEELDREAEELPATLVLNVSDMVRRWLVDSYNTGRQGAVPLDLEAFLRCLVFRIGANPTAKLVQETLGMDADGVVGRATTAALRRAHDEDPNGYMQKLYEATLAYLQSKFGDSPSFASLTRQTQQMLDAAIALRQIPLEEQALIDRARSAIGKDTRYVLGKGGMRPLDPHPAQDGECDCSGFIAWVLGSSRQSKNEFYVKELEGWMDVTRMQKDILTEGGFLKPCAPKPGCFAAYGSGDESARNIALVTEVVLRDGKLVPSKVVGCTRNNAQTGDAILEYPADDFVKDPTTVYGELDPRLNALNGSLEMFLKENQPLLRQMIAEANIFAASRTISALIPLTETDAWLSIASDAQWGEDRSGHRDEHAAPGTRHLMPMPENLAAWLDEAVPGAGATMTTELNMRCWLRYLAIVKNKDVTGPPQHLHRGLFLSAGIAGNEVRQARLLTGVIHGHFLASAYRDEAPPVKALIQGYVSELTLPQLLEGTSYLHAGTPLISSRQTKLDQALGWLRASK
ncbi:MAG TPA: hypothetical protein VGE67_06790 [Haloferula sp.]